MWQLDQLDNLSDKDIQELKDILEEMYESTQTNPVRIFKNKRIDLYTLQDFFE